MTKKIKKNIEIINKLRNYFFTGLVIAAPIIITIFSIKWVIDLIDNWVLPFIPKSYLPETYLEFSMPGLGVIFAIFWLIILGALTANFVGYTIINITTSWLEKMPIIRIVYKILKQIFETVISQSKTNFKQVALVEYPRKGLFVIAFIVSETKGQISKQFDENMINLFLPTTPNPTSGFLLFAPKKDVKILNMSVEDGAKLVISAGLIMPNNL